MDHELEYVTGDEAAVAYLCRIGHKMHVTTFRAHLRQNSGPARDSFNGRNRYATAVLRQWVMDHAKLKSNRGRKRCGAIPVPPSPGGNPHGDALKREGAMCDVPH